MLCFTNTAAVTIKETDTGCGCRAGSNAKQMMEIITCFSAFTYINYSC